jgi:hypothetical protein
MPNSPSRLDDADIARAQAVSIADIAIERGFVFDRAGNHAGPCPRCGGKDRFSISVRKGAFLSAVSAFRRAAARSRSSCFSMMSASATRSRR